MNLQSIVKNPVANPYDNRRNINPDKLAAVAVLGELLGRRLRRKKARKALARKMRGRAAVKKFKKLSPAAQKAKLTAAVKKASPKTKKKFLALALARRLKLKKGAAKVKAAMARNPKLKRAILTRLAKNKVKNLAANAQNPAFPMPSTSDSHSAVPQGVPVSPPPSEAPVEPAVEECHVPTPAETVEAATEEEALDTAEAVDESREEAQEEVEQDTAEAADAETDAANADELTEPTDEEAAEEAEAEAEDAADDEQAVAGDSMLGAIKRAVKKKARQKRVLAATKPIAVALHKKSGGKIPAKQTMQGCALIQAAKAGNVKAKAAIKALQVKAKKGNPAAKKTLAQLKLCNATLKKARKVVAKRVAAPPKRLAAPTRKALPPVKRTVYNTPVKLHTKGLKSYSAHQRGLAMIPAVSRSMFRGVAGEE